MAHTSSFQKDARAETATLVNGIILIALGLSIFFLNLWDNLLVRSCVSLFWTMFFLISNGPELLALIRTMRSPEQSHD